MESKVHMQNIKKLWFQNNILLDILSFFFNKLLMKHSIEMKAFGSYNSHCGWAQAISSGVFKTILCIHFARNTLRFECAQNVLCRWRHSAWNTGASKIRSVGNWTVCTLYCHLILLLVWFVCVKMLGKSYIAHGSGNEVSERASEQASMRIIECAFYPVILSHQHRVIEANREEWWRFMRTLLHISNSSAPHTHSTTKFYMGIGSSKHFSFLLVLVYWWWCCCWFCCYCCFYFHQK